MVCDLGRQRIARIDKSEQRLKRMIAIIAPLADVERKVDLGVGGFGEDQELHPRSLVIKKLHQFKNLSLMA